MSVLLEIKNLYAGYKHGQWIIKNINIAVCKGESVGLAGANGCGKSTLAKAVMGLVPFVKGDIIFRGVNITKMPTYKRRSLGLGFFMQGGEVFPNLSVEDNIKFILSNYPKDERIIRRQRWLENFGLFFNPKKGRLGLKASYLSGGEKHQLALAMVLLQEPKFLILDEPSAGVASKILNEVINMLTTQLKGQSYLLIEHNKELLKNVDKIERI